MESERAQLKSRAHEALPIVTQRCKVHVANKHMDNDIKANQQEISCITNQTWLFECQLIINSACYTKSNLWLKDIHVDHVCEVSNTLPK